MQVISPPHTDKDMTVAVSMSGITILNQGKYKVRHGGSKEIVQKPREGFILRKNDTLENERLAIINSKKRKKKPSTNPTISHTKKPPQYIINKKQIIHRIRNFTNQMTGEKKLYFWTITFPLLTSDDTAFILFNKWLTRVRKELNLRSYLWVSERQKNGTIHFHIALHQRLCVKKGNRYMRACIFTCIDNSQISYSREEAKKYNGVDIAKHRKTKRVINFAQRKSGKTLTTYLTKYVTKNLTTFTHLAWHCSRDYSNLIIAIHLTPNEYILQIKIQDLSTQKTIIAEWFTFIPWLNGPPKKIINYLAFVNQKVVKIIENDRTKQCIISHN